MQGLEVFEQENEDGGDRLGDYLFVATDIDRELHRLNHSRSVETFKQALRMGHYKQKGTHRERERVEAYGISTGRISCRMFIDSVFVFVAGAAANSTFSSPICTTYISLFSYLLI